MDDTKRLHRQVCKNFHSSLDFSLDGIQECKSSSLSADVYTVSFSHCRSVYPIRIVRPINKFKMNDQEQLGSVINDINQCDCIIKNAIGDNPKRSCFRCGLSHAATFACEYCEGKVVHYKDPELGRNKRGHLIWPSSTAEAEKRTLDSVREIIEKLRNGNILSKEESKGFWGVSHLIHQNNFHFIQNIPAEYMHCGCLGTVKRALELTFSVGEKRDRNTTRKLSDPKDYNKLISQVQVPREYNRRFRNLDLGVMKAQEYRNVILFFFDIVLNCIPDTYTREKKVWLQLAYILRACVLPNKEFKNVSENVILATSKSFYKNYEAVYGEKNCTYSIHLIGNHLLDIKGNVPLTERSAFKYENFYGELRNLFQPGTTAPSKQMLQNCYMKRILENHNCKKSIFYDIEKSGKENNSLVYMIISLDFR